MINHARTLLMNRTVAVPDYAFLGEEYVPPEFHALALPGFLTAPARILLGDDPDREFMNYRLRQLMTVLHSTPFVAHALELDSRFTYATGEDSTLFAETLFRPTIVQTAGAPAAVTVLGLPTSPDAQGRIRNSYGLEILGSTISVVRETPPAAQAFPTYTVTAGLSSPVPLLPTGYYLLIASAEVGASWVIEVKTRPQRSLGDLTMALANIGEPNLLALFGTAKTEPYLTFRNLWNDHPNMAYKLSGFLLAMIYRTEEIRTR